MSLFRRLVHSSAPTRHHRTTFSRYAAAISTKKSLARALSSLPATSGGTGAVLYDFENLVEMQEKSCREFRDRKLFGTKIGKEFSWMTFGEFATEVGSCFLSPLFLDPISLSPLFRLINAEVFLLATRLGLTIRSH
jgi:hypothetical protein